MNQASLNALSLAMLFAQAEDRAQHGGLAWVVLDDPVQSLDDAHQTGLAKAIERLAAACRILVAATPSPFVSRLEEYVPLPRRFVMLADWKPSTGARIREVREP